MTHIVAKSETSVDKLCHLTTEAVDTFDWGSYLLDEEDRNFVSYAVSRRTLGKTFVICMGSRKRTDKLGLVIAG